MIGILIGIILFVVTIPVKTTQLAFSTVNGIKTISEKINNIKLKSKEDSEMSKLKSSSELSQYKEQKNAEKKASIIDKTKQATRKVGKVALSLAVKTVKLIVFGLRVLATMFFTFGLVGGLILVLVSYLLIASVGYVAVVMNADSLGNYTSTPSTSTNAGGSTAVSADVQKIINMSESEVWQLISEGKYSSYSDANEAAKANPSSEESFWSGLLVNVEVPCWKWEDSSKTTKVSSTTTIKVNKYVADYFKSYMTDLYNLPEQYVIVSVGGYSFRTKNNSSGANNYSGHSFGATLDINPESNGMGSYSAGYGEAGIPWNTSSGLADPMKSECCTFDNSWHDVAKKYNLDWGGNWSQSYLDPMHFSLVGDNSKDSRGFDHKAKGRTP